MFVAEEPLGAGPVPALRRGLAEAAPPWLAVLAADLPFLRADDLRALRRAAAGHDGAVLADDAGRPQWLVGCWRTETLRRAAAGDDGTSLGGLLGPLGPVLVRRVPVPGEPPSWLDCDTPEDLDLGPAAGRAVRARRRRAGRRGRARRRSAVPYQGYR